MPRLYLLLSTHQRTIQQEGKDGAPRPPPLLGGGGDGQLIVELFLFHVALPVLLERFRSVRASRSFHLL